MKQQSSKDRRIKRRGELSPVSDECIEEDSRCIQRRDESISVSHEQAKEHDEYLQRHDEPMPVSHERTAQNPDPHKSVSFFSKEALGYSPLNFYHLFWIFIIASVFGLVLETIYHFLLFGGYESRAGLVWGPFSPIYGCGAVLFTLISRGKQVERKSKAIIIVFLACALGGAVLEFITSWLMQNLFGITAWDYSNEFLNIDGRTSLLFSVLWGILGTVWICWFLPAILKIIDSIPDGKHVLVTTLVSIFMLLNILTTIMAIDRAYERSMGIPGQDQIDAIMDTLYSDDFISSHFENATIEPDASESE